MRPSPQPDTLNPKPSWCLLQQSTQVSIVPILVGVSGTIYKEHTINALRQLGVSSSRAMARLMFKWLARRNFTLL
eukprot:365126-Chlamydomonas_euryale.AAC.64